MEKDIEHFLEDFKDLLGHPVKTQIIQERVREEGVLYSVIIRPFFDERSKFFGMVEGYPSSADLKKITRRVSSSFKKAAKMNPRIALDPDGFLQKPVSKKYRGKSYYTFSSAYLHMVFVKRP
jgi:hypothetical protein